MTKSEARQARAVAKNSGHPCFDGLECFRCGTTKRYVGNSGCVACTESRRFGTRGTREKLYEGKPCTTCNRTIRYKSNSWCIFCSSSKTVFHREKLRLTNPEKECLQRMVGHARSRSKKRGIICSIHYTDLTIPKVCPLLGIPLDIKRGVFGPDSPSLDRIDPTKGYVVGNVWVVSFRANNLKGDATVAEMRSILDNTLSKLQGN